MSDSRVETDGADGWVRGDKDKLKTLSGSETVADFKTVSNEVDNY